MPHISLPYSKIGSIKCWNKWNTIFIGRVPMHFVFFYILKTALSHKCLWLVEKNIFLSIINAAYHYPKISILFNGFYSLAVEVKSVVLVFSKDHYFSFRFINNHKVFCTKIAIDRQVAFVGPSRCQTKAQGRRPTINGRWFPPIYIYQHVGLDFAFVFHCSVKFVCKYLFWNPNRNWRIATAVLLWLWNVLTPPPPWTKWLKFRRRYFQMHFR